MPGPCSIFLGERTMKKGEEEKEENRDEPLCMY